MTLLGEPMLPIFLALEPSFVCYQVTNTGTVINLDSLCAQAQIENEDSQAETGLVITQWTYNDSGISGVVQNNSDQTAEQVEIVYQILGTTGVVLYEGRSPVFTLTLQPGQSSEFSFQPPITGDSANVKPRWVVFD